MKMRMTNVPFQATSLSPLVPNSTRESLSIMEKNHAIDLTGFVIMCLDVWYGKTSNFSWFTRCGVDVTSFRIMDWSKNLGVICNDDTLAETTLTTTIRKWNAETRKDIEVEFIDVDISDINDMINWLRVEKDIFYAPPKERKADCDSKLVTETQKLQEENKKLEEKLEIAKEMENWYIRTNRELVMERDKYRDTCEELKQDVYEWEDRFDKICDELDTSERDFDEVFDELRKNLNELDKLAEFKAKLAEVIKLPEDMKGTATTEDYISSFEHTKNEWRKMEIKLENYEREIRLLNEWLEDRKKKLDDILPDYTNAKCARAELANLYRRTFEVDRLDPELSPHEIAVQIRKRMRELEQKLNSIKEIYDGDGV